ncbi:hypothetical protein ABT275_44960 [Streptomyces sp. NPDC001185]|uniref:hypothetical protein n=1 Tax=Streptomyces sp. NPDC001185 TaxID=3154380 RepID=UPI003329354F
MGLTVGFIELLDADTLPALFGKQPGTLTPWDCSHATLYRGTSAARLEDFSVSDGSGGLRPHMSGSGAPGLPALNPHTAELHQAA